MLLRSFKNAGAVAISNELSFDTYLRTDPVNILNRITGRELYHTQPDLENDRNLCQKLLEVLSYPWNNSIDRFLCSG